MSLPLSGSQTVGPYFSIGLAPLCSEEVASVAQGEAVIVEGNLLDGEGVAIPDGFLEIWQANGDGRYIMNKPASSAAEAVGFGRIRTRPDGSFRFATIKPGAVPYDAERMQAPHLVVLVYMRGLLRNLVTRIYFADELANLTDPILQLVPAERRSTLIAQAGSKPGTLHWDIVMQQQEANAKPETVFFAW
jgi:protocatechuate 3,4-dioxygenase alpha subunit